MSGLEFADVLIERPDGSALLGPIQLRWPAGITALVGANGVGKSTLLRAIAGLVPLARGRIGLGGDDNRKARGRFQRRMAFMPQNFTAYRNLTAEEFMRYLLSLRGVDGRVAAQASDMWLDRVGLGDVARQRTGSFSQGMLQRLGFATTLQLEVELYLFDEPFAGIDPAARADLTDLLFTLVPDRLVIVSTHHVEEMSMRRANLVHLADGKVVP